MTTCVQLEVCPECDGSLVYPTWWSEYGPAAWEIRLRCPDCEWTEHGIYLHEDVVRYDEVLNQATAQVVETLETLERASMEADIERFVRALDTGLIVPFDF